MTRPGMTHKINKENIKGVSNETFYTAPHGSLFGRLPYEILSMM